MTALEYFKALTQVPRCSYEEAGVLDYLKNFADRQNLTYRQDQKGNLVIYKDAQGVNSDRQMQPIILQGHVDMVCVKESNCNKDMSKDPLDIYEEEGFLRARGTTLGADNGAAVAMIQAILSDKKRSHPPIEALFTVEEEVGLTGAAAVEADFFKGRTLINIDTEEEGTFIVSCAGGCRSDMIFPKTQEDNPFQQSYELVIDGLKGGHSGMEIHRQRASALKLIPRVLKGLNLRLVELKAGEADNAICHEAKVIFSSDEDLHVLEETIEARKRELQKEFALSDPGLEISLKAQDHNSNKVLSRQLTENILKALTLIPHGVMRKMDAMDMVETSTNLALIRTQEDHIVISGSHRSSSEAQKQVLIETIEIIGELLGAKVELRGNYPGWDYEPKSKIRDCFVKLYTEIYGQEPQVEGIHAGLECGILQERIGKLDMISLGPNMAHVHSPKEEMELASFHRVFDFIVQVLETLAREQA